MPSKNYSRKYNKKNKHNKTRYVGGTTRSSRKPLVIVGKVYADWCGHCQTLKPQWSKMKSMLGKIPGFQFIEIEESQTGKMAKLKAKYPDLKISGYPTIFKKKMGGELEYFQGERSAESIGDWAKQ